MPVSGMKVSQAINDARRWWNGPGRDYARRNRDRPNDGIRDDEEIMAKSGIQSGKMFDAMTKIERNDIVKAWHHAFCESELDIPMTEFLKRAQVEIFGVVLKPEAFDGASMDTYSGLQ